MGLDRGIKKARTDNSVMYSQPSTTANEITMWNMLAQTHFLPLDDPARLV